VHCCRTPILRAKKNAEDAPALSTLIASVFSDCIKHVAAKDIDDICVGNVLSPASHLACFRMAALSCGIPSSVPISVINRQCASGLEAMNVMANSIMAGQIEVGIAAGAECMSHHKMTEIPPPDVDWDNINMNGEEMDCLIPMGVTSENVSKEFHVARKDMDEIAALSHKRATNAKFQQEIVGGGKDTGVRPNTTVETLSKLKPAFQGNTTAGNASQISDGAAAILLMSRRAAEQQGLPIMAVWRACQTVGVPPRIMGIGPVPAIRTLFEKYHITQEDIDLFEINEAFASQFLYCIRELKLPKEKVNVNGGAIALGHPLGCTGARLVVSIVHELRRRGARTGVVSMCVGTGMGSAALIEVPPRSKL